MRQTRTNYWSCSTFANWIRGTAKPKSETSEGWNEWHKSSKRASPLRYWIAEEGLDRLQNMFYFPNDVYHSVRYYIANRWITRSHALTAHPRDIPRGEWRDLGNRFLPCMFNELVDFIEVELAGNYVAWNSEEREKYAAPARFYRSWRTWRSPEAGMAYLNWAKDLDNSEWLPEEEKDKAEPTHQALAAREMLALYDWWKNIYPNRPDPHDASGWSAYCEQRRANRSEDDGPLFALSSYSDEERQHTRAILDECNRIEAEYEEEDTQMMIRLLKIRKQLWT